MLKEISIFSDVRAAQRGEPGLVHSYISSLATALHTMGAPVNGTWLMGTSGFAFRIWVNETLCPSAMSVFDWSALIPETVEQIGYGCTYVSRLWNEEEHEATRREEAHGAIVAGIDRGAPAVVWDVADCEWGLIVGYDDEKKTYGAISSAGKAISLPYDKLGQREIKILSVAVPGDTNDRPRDEVIRKSLEAAVAHADQKEWAERPTYQDGLPAFEQWASVYEKWNLLAQGGKAEKVNDAVGFFSAYYTSHYVSARCYAKEYLKTIADGSELLLEAATHYERVVEQLKPAFVFFLKKESPEPESLTTFASQVRAARDAEEQAIDCIRKHLANG